MSINETPAPNPPAEAMTPDVMVAQLRAMREHVPEYTQLAIPDARAIRRVAHVNQELVQAAINSLGASDGVQNLLGVTAAEVQHETEDAARWTAVEDELRAMLSGVAAANLIRRHRIGLVTLQTYNICSQLVRKKEHANLMPHVETMKRLNKFGRKRAKTPPQPEPQPAPAA
jgi:hypothetical protein